jgi:hypothetical protein
MPEQRSTAPRASSRVREQQDAPAALMSKPGSAKPTQPVRNKRQIPALFLPPVPEKQDN